MKNTTTTPQTTYLRDYCPSSFSITSVDLYFSLFETHASVKSRLNVEANGQGAGDLVLDGLDLELVSVRIDGSLLHETRYQVCPESLTIFQVPEVFVLEIETKIMPAKNTSLEGLYLSNGNYCSQCEPQGFRKITYFLDRPDVMATYTTTIEADKEAMPILLSNGNLIESGDIGASRHFAKWQDPFKKPSYLFAIVAGKLVNVDASYRTTSGRDILLQIYVESHNTAKCGHALSSLQKAMAWDEEVFGLEYDLDQYMIVAVDDFNSGAMENKGLNIFNSKYILAEPTTATDDDYAGIEGVVAHEYFHNWTGNRVTCRDWFQLSLKEGLTVFRDQQFSADMTSRPVQRIQDVALLRSHQFPEDSGPMSHQVRPDSYIEINNFYTLTVYEKGAEVIRMFHTLLGTNVFRRGMDIYFERYDGQAVTTEDFAGAMADAYGEDVTAPAINFEQFRLWYNQAGTPELRVSSHYDAQEQTFSLTVRQEAPANADDSYQMMLLPLAIGLLDTKGNDLLLRDQKVVTADGCGTKILRVTKEEETFIFSHIAERPVPSLLRGFSAPINLYYEYSDDELLFLMCHDSDKFNRWEAGQRFFTRQLLSLIEIQQKGAEMTLAANVESLFAKFLAPDFEKDTSFLAQMLTLPSHGYLAERLDVVDVEAIHGARKFMRTALAEALKEQFLKVYRVHSDKEPYRYDPLLAGRRRLKNLCLSYLSLLDDEEIWTVTLKQFSEADNMSDEMAALGAMVHGDCPARPKVVAEFFEKWQHEALVMDKWLVVQATAPLSGTLAEVVGLMAHPIFSMTNPNKVRSLIGAFAGANPLCFHAKDGSGYCFLVDRVLELDPLNPHIAARLLGHLSCWRKYDVLRQGLMKRELERVVGCTSLSKGVYEVAAKCLADV